MTDTTCTHCGARQLAEGLPNAYCDACLAAAEQASPDGLIPELPVATDIVDGQLDAEPIGEKRADQLTAGDTYSEYGLDAVTIAKLDHHGDAVLVTTTDGVETTIDGDTPVEFYGHTDPVETADETPDTGGLHAVAGDPADPEHDGDTVTLVTVSHDGTATDIVTYLTRDRAGKLATELSAIVGATCELFILSIDSDDDYSATLHDSTVAVTDALADWTQAHGYEHQLDQLDDIVEWLQDHDVEVNVTPTTLP